MSLLWVPRSTNCQQATFTDWLDSICRTPSALPPTLLASICDRWMQGRNSEMSIMWRAKLADMSPPNSVNHHWPFWVRVLFAAYMAWNVAWLASERIPPSLLRGLFGIPCPTTGCTRSLIFLFHGNLQASLLWNPFTVPILILLIDSSQILFLCALREMELVLPKWIGTAWWSILVLAWVSKFLIGPAYW